MRRLTNSLFRHRHPDFVYHEDHEGHEVNSSVIPAAAGIQVRVGSGMDTGFRRYDIKRIFACVSAARDPLWCTFLLVSLSLVGCGTFSARPDPSRFFTLTAIAQPGAALVGNDSGSLAGVSVGLGPIRLPSYLDREEIVTRVSANRIDFSEYDRWAEPLDASFTRVLAQNLSVLLHTDRLVFYPWELNRRPNYQVTVQVVRFESNDRGEVQLSARWEIFDISNNNRIPLRAGESGITRQPTASSTDASVAALSEALGDLSREITSAMNAVDGQKR
jgi:uncharacterized lipoprotein YmbA